MAKDVIKMVGKIITAHSTTEYEVKLENGIVVKAVVSGKMRVNHIRLLPGDNVDVEISPYDLTRGRITYRR